MKIIIDAVSELAKISWNKLKPTEKALLAATSATLVLAMVSYGMSSRQQKKQRLMHP
ncbi:hypothetical protein MOZ60_00155 [Stecheria sp. CLA-KB-P133]|uniref:Uncharacterized protein n=1 Tax=Grylomicrobium aquisgranensis TaxID=2926318 RepID=A0AB35U4A0_9FIRM|nr:hypothetical protein [Lactimicrobium massiliense]MDX8418502.1 hypothetical protein [Stecheria sp. CLA-KB-P133]